VLGDTSKKPQPFDFEYNTSKNNILDNSCGRPIYIPSSPSSSSSDDSSMLDIVGRAAIYDEIFKLDD